MIRYNEKTLEMTKPQTDLEDFRKKYLYNTYTYLVTYLHNIHFLLNLMWAKIQKWGTNDTYLCLKKKLIKKKYEEKHV